MRERLIALAGGLIAAFGSLAILLRLNRLIHSASPTLQSNEPHIMGQHLAQLPWSAQTGFALAWLAAALIGARVASALAPTRKRGAALSIGVCLTAAALSFAIRLAPVFWPLVMVAVLMPFACSRSVRRSD